MDSVFLTKRLRQWAAADNAKSKTNKSQFIGTQIYDFLLLPISHCEVLENDIFNDIARKEILPVVPRLLLD